MWRLVTGGAYVLWTDDRRLAEAVKQQIDGSLRERFYKGEYPVIFPYSKREQVKQICEAWEKEAGK